MATEIRPSGIVVETRGGAAVERALPLRRRRLGQLTQPSTAPGAGRRRSAGATAAAQPMSEEEAIINALEDQELDFLDAVPLTAPATTPPRTGSRRRRTGGGAAAPGPAQVDLQVPVGADEFAVVLVENDGVYEWLIDSGEGPTPIAPVASARRGRRRSGSAADAPAPTAAATHTRTFTITIPPAAGGDAATAGAATRRGGKRRGSLLRKLGLGKAVAYVFRFAAKPLLRGATKFMERNVVEGLIHVTGLDPTVWPRLGDDAPIKTPTDRPARVLLLVHGTFSSTVGSFGALAGQVQGRAFLESALKHYDLVIGWDHRTLSAVPTDNAVDIAQRLRQIGFTQPPVVDAIAYSRGGLVLRSLIEQVLPSTPSLLTIRRAVFVACTNGGTELARPKNWHRLVDRYTNLAAAGARVAGMVPTFTAGATILSSAIRGVGSFVKALATSAVDDGAVPGLSAMDPAGAFVKEINKAQKGQPTPDQTYYCAITSNFDPDTASRSADPEIVPPGLILKLADKAADKLMETVNDLVVHVESMTAIDPLHGKFVRDTYAFGTNGRVHHCSYFSQSETADALTRWFDVPTTIVASTKPGGRRGGSTRTKTAAKTAGKAAGKTARKSAGTRAAKTAATSAAKRAAKSAAKSAAAATRPAPAVLVEAGRAATDALVTVRSTMTAARALPRVRDSHADWVVVERAGKQPSGAPTVFHYAHRKAAALAWLQHADPNDTVHEVFELRETRASHEVPEGTTAQPTSLGAHQSAEVLRYHHGSHFRGVVMRAGTPVAVIPALEEIEHFTSAAPPISGAAPAPPSPIPVPYPSGSAGARRRGATRSATRGASGGAARGGGAKKAASPAPSTPTDTPAPRPSAARPTKPSFAPAGSVDLNVRAVTDDEYVVDETHTVVVTIAREELAVLVGRAAGVARGRAKASKPLIVECIPMLRTSLVDPEDGRVEVPVPAAGAPVELRFDVVAREKGDAEVRVQVRQGPLPLATLTLAMTVCAARTGSRRELRASAGVNEPSSLPAATDELRIIQLRPTGGSTQYRYELRLPSLRVQQEFLSEELKTDPGSYVSQIYTRIEDRWTEHKSEQKAFARDLRAIGVSLFDEIFPLELRVLLWQYRDKIRAVQVLSSEPFIPWELVHLRDPMQKRLGDDTVFLGELGVVRWLVNGYAPETVRLRKGKARYVIPEYPDPEDQLPEAQLEVDLVTSRFNATPVDAEAEAIYELLAEPGAFDLLHIACHGLADVNDIGSARLAMPGKPRADGSLSEEDVMAMTVLHEANLHDTTTDSQPIVVLNACQSGRAGYTLKGMGGFAQAFVERGAGVFIGSSWSVGDTTARAFIDEFYAHFLAGGKKRVPLATAVAAARRKARDDGDATWLAYVVYGHPRAVADVR